MEVKESETFKSIKCKFGVLSRPHGSALLCQGETAVMAGVYGPVEAKRSKLLIEKASVEVYYRPKAGLPGIGDRFYEDVVKNTCETALISALFPRSSVLVIIQEMQNCGGLLSCAVNAACLALVDSGVDMKFLLGAVCCAVDENGELHVDPGPLVAENAKASFDFVFENINNEVVASYTTGSFTVEQYQQALQKCRLATIYIFTFYKDVIARKYK